MNVNTTFGLEKKYIEKTLKKEKFCSEKKRKKIEKENKIKRGRVKMWREETQRIVVKEIITGQLDKANTRTTKTGKAEDSHTTQMFEKKSKEKKLTKKHSLKSPGNKR